MPLNLEPEQKVKFDWLKLREAADHFDNLVYTFTSYTPAELRLLVHIAENNELPKKAHWWGIKELGKFEEMGIVRLIDHGKNVTVAITGRGHVLANEAWQLAQLVDESFYHAFGHFGEYGYEYNVDDLDLVLNVQEIAE
jgi:hypothetical protein